MAARSSAQIPARPRHGGSGGFEGFEEAFFRAGEVIGNRPESQVPAPPTWRRALARAAALTIFSAALVMAWKAFGNTLRHEVGIRTQLERSAMSAQLVGDSEAWSAPSVTARAATPRQRPHSTTAARNRRR